MTGAAIQRELLEQLSELLDGAPEGGHVLNEGDVGLLASLDRLSASAASVSHGGASVAGHAGHLQFSLSLFARRLAGENPQADWRGSWRFGAVDEAQWASLRADLRAAAESALNAVRGLDTVDDARFGRIVGALAHLSYHLGAIRQIDRGARGPAAS